MHMCTLLHIENNYAYVYTTAYREQLCMCTLLHIENNYAYVYTTGYREQLCICVHYYICTQGGE